MPKPATTAPADRRALIEQLAPLVWRDRQREAEHYAALHKTTRPPYYFLNVNHPTIKRLYLRYLHHSLDGGALTQPISDLDRVRFELSLLHPAVLRMLAEEYAEREDTHDDLPIVEPAPAIHRADAGRQENAGNTQDGTQGGENRPGRRSGRPAAIWACMR